MIQACRKGDRVRWSSNGGEAVGTVERVITADTEAAGRTVRASRGEPQYLVRSAKSGRTAVHKPDALRRVISPRTVACEARRARSLWALSTPSR
jgi:Hypervirulence associated proteins TUDOR domain